MKRTTGFLFGLVALLLATSILAFGQEKQTTFEREVPPPLGLALKEPGQGEIRNTFTFMNAEFSFDRLVKGAPYSAQAITEITQLLSDGNRIVNTSSSSVYRDGEGRTRREQTLKAIGNFSAQGEPVQTISINDPVAGVAYVLEPHSRAARKVQGLRVEGNNEAGFTVSARGGEGEVLTLGSADGEVRTRRGTPAAKVREERERSNFREEDLGSQTIEGVNAVGTRTIITIPPGQIGNERAIEIVDERWFSPDLQMVVKTRHSDPRSGEIVYRLTNISRTEPDHSLFEVPSDYKLWEEPQQRHRVRTDKPVPEQ